MLPFVHRVPSSEWRQVHAEHERLSVVLVLNADFSVYVVTGHVWSPVL